MLCSKVRVKREDEGAETRWKLRLREKAILVGETDEGDGNGWRDCGYSTERDLKGTVQHCVSIWVFRLDSGLA